MLAGIGLRVSMFGETGKDFQVYINAAADFTNKINPYERTTKSFSDPNAMAGHGFSYLPGFLFLYLPFYIITRNYQDFSVVCKIPVLLADIGICILLFKQLSKQSKWAAFFAVAVWFFNPYFVLKQNFVYMDPVPIFFMLLALIYLGKKEGKSAIFYAVACVFKTFPVILFPIFLLKTKNKLRFLAWGAIPFILVSLPFLHDPLTYIKGALLVHSDRPMEGKPFLYTISYKLSIELIRVIPTIVYTSLAIFGGWVMVVVNELLKKINKGLKFESKYIYSFLSFVIFYLFTPVLNRTYLLWVMPVAILAGFDLMKEKRWPAWTYYAMIGVFYLFYVYYLLVWGKGLHVDYEYY
jgi:hypothetical protein